MFDLELKMILEYIYLQTLSIRFLVGLTLPCFMCPGCWLEDKIMKKREIKDGQIQQDELVRCLSECFCKKYLKQ